jgi:hypothetical protein
MRRLTWMTALLALVGSALSGPASEAGWPFYSESGLRRGSPEYMEARAAEPPGMRQKYHHGKLWPPFPRPAGKELPWVHKYHHAHYWPHPYTCQDQHVIRNLARTQVANGWQSATTLFDYHFDPATHELNAAGKSHLNWLLAHVPHEYRQAHVAAADNPEFNSVRVLSVEREIARSVGEHQDVPVLLRVAEPIGRPASEVHWIFRQAQENMLPPAIEYTNAGASGSTSP